MVIALANTGKDSNRRNAVIRILHANSGITCKFRPRERILKMVTIKLIAPRIEDIPAR